MKNYDKSLVEVWEWKERVYHEMRDLNEKDYVMKIREDAEKMLSENNIRLDTVSLHDLQKV